MITTFQQIRAIAQDIRFNINFNNIEDKQLREHYLRVIEDLCSKSIIILNQMENGSN